MCNTQAWQKQQDPATDTAQEDRKSRDMWWFEGVHLTHAYKSHSKRVTPLPGDEGLYNGLRAKGQKMLFSMSRKKEGSQEVLLFTSTAHY